MPEFVSPAAEAHFQYGSAEHQAKTSLAGMWLFLATELLFFGALFYLWLLLRFWHPDGFVAAAHDTDLLIGTINTVLLTTSSFLYWFALGEAKQGRGRQALIAIGITAAIGLAFLVLKGLEWGEDIGKGKLPGQSFVATGPDPGGQHLFWLLYYAGTGLHGLHMLAGLVLLAWIARRIWRDGIEARSATPVEAVGLYWSFVDVVWINLYPFIYILDRR